VDDGFCAWRVPSLLIHGSSDSFLDLNTALDWLESKRTSMRMASGIEAKLGHMPQARQFRVYAGRGAGEEPRGAGPAAARL
jgi:hypothetical protein